MLRNQTSYSLNVTFEEKFKILAFSLRPRKSMIAVKIRILSREIRIFYFYRFAPLWPYSIFKKIKKVLYTECPICIWTNLWGCLEVTGWLKIKKFNSNKKFMQIPLRVNKVYFFDIKHVASQWPFEKKIKK